MQFSFPSDGFFTFNVRNVYSLQSSQFFTLTGTMVGLIYFQIKAATGSSHSSIAHA